mmetsp:Transcript_8137/g.27053  ORF Transcript_8137/g.27053 Transcript_8137/m.27053 type:complete len:201 (-) Transcript_8137:231-833(-)
MNLMLRLRHPRAECGRTGRSARPDGDAEEGLPIFDGVAVAARGPPLPSSLSRPAVLRAEAADASFCVIVPSSQRRRCRRRSSCCMSSSFRDRSRLALTLLSRRSSANCRVTSRTLRARSASLMIFSLSFSREKASLRWTVSTHSHRSSRRSIRSSFRFAAVSVRSSWVLASLASAFIRASIISCLRLFSLLSARSIAESL